MLYANDADAYDIDSLKPNRTETSLIASPHRSWGFYDNDKIE